MVADVDLPVPIPDATAGRRSPNWAQWVTIGLTALAAGALGGWVGFWAAESRGLRQLQRAQADVASLRRQLETVSGEAGEAEGRHACERLLLDYLQSRQDPPAASGSDAPAAQAAETRLVMLLAKWLRQGPRAPGQVELPAPGSSDPGSILFPDGSRRTLPATIAARVRGIRGGPG